MPHCSTTHTEDAPDLPFRLVQKECWLVAEEHGWHDSIHEHTFMEKLLLVHSELSEALEEYRDGHGFTDVYYVDSKPEGIPIELADAVIRLLDLAEIYKIDLSWAIQEKQAYNKTRAYKHGGKKV